MRTVEIIDQMEDVMSAIGITGNDCHGENFICFDAQMPDRDYSIHVFILIDAVNSSVSMNIHPDYDITDEKVSLVMEMVNQINKYSAAHYVVFKPDLNKVAIMTALMLSEGNELDNAEFEKSIRILLGNAEFYLDLVKERISSKEKTVDIFDRMYKDFSDNH